jgi:hypothetical protein
MPHPQPSHHPEASAYGSRVRAPAAPPHRTGALHLALLRRGDKGGDPVGGRAARRGAHTGPETTTIFILDRLQTVPAQPVYNLDQTQIRGLLVRPLGTSNHLEKPPRIFFPPGLPNEMVTIPAAANNAISYISRIRKAAVCVAARRYNLVCVRVPPQRTRATPPTRVWIKLSELSEFQKVDRERGIEGPQRAPAEIRVPVHAAMGREPM